MTPRLNKLVVENPIFSLMINVSELNTDDIVSFSLQVYDYEKSVVFSEKIEY